MGSRLKERVAIVTGAGSASGPPGSNPIGNGRATAIVFAREGASVLAVDINLESVEATREMIEKEGGICSVFKADVSQSKDCQAMAEVCLKTYGRIDILHNNVGIGPRKPEEIMKVDEEDWDFMMNVNAKSMFNTCRAVIPQMLKQESGSIVNISSASAVQVRNRAGLLYGTSKGAVNTFTLYLAAELADKGIRVNCVMPGRIDSPSSYQRVWRYGGDIERMKKERGEKVPMKRMGEPWDIAYAALFFVSDEAKYVTGQILAVDGGSLMAPGTL